MRKERVDREGGTVGVIRKKEAFNKDGESTLTTKNALTVHVGDKVYKVFLTYGFRFFGELPRHEPDRGGTCGGIWQLYGVLEGQKQV